MSSSDNGLIFIYNADSGLFNTVSDIAHKIFSPQTYQCDLCAITHGYFSVRAQWQGVIEQLGVPCEFLHRDQVGGYPQIDQNRLPAVYRRHGDEVRMCLGPDEIGACRDIASLAVMLRSHCLAAGQR